MTAPTPQTTSTHPLKLTATQARALLQTLLSTTPIPTGRPSFNPSQPRPIHRVGTTTSRIQIAPSPTTTTTTTTTITTITPSTTITIDTSTRIMGHCNRVSLPSSPANTTEQATALAQLLTTQLTEQAGSHRQGSGELKIVVNAGVQIMGSKNIVVFGGNGRAGVGGQGQGHVGDKEGGIGGRKRGAEDDAEEGDKGGKREKVNDEDVSQLSPGI
ncbi:MAG: hypothetical protein Q9164_004167 [Protoblastenia rupestris]